MTVLKQVLNKYLLNVVEGTDVNGVLPSSFFLKIFTQMFLPLNF